MRSLRCSSDESLVIKTFVICFFMCGTCCAYKGRTLADDISRQRTPMDLMRETLNFILSQPDIHFVQNLHDLQGELLQTDFDQLVKDVLDSGVLGNSKREDRSLETEGIPLRSQRFEYEVDAQANGTTPVSNLTTEQSNTTAGTYSTTMLENITTTHYISTTMAQNATTESPTPIPANPECLNHTAQTFMAVLERQSWALQMIDADGRPVPNLKGYQFLWVGDYEECTKVRAVDNSSGTEQFLFKGRYCTAVIPFQPSDVRPLMPAVPPTGIRAGLCVPDSCSGLDITLILNDVLDLRNSSLKVGLTTCQEEEVEYDAKAIIVLLLCSVFLLMMTLGTVYDLLVIQWPARTAEASDSAGDSTAIVGDGYSFIGNPVTDRPSSVNVKVDGETEPLLGGKKKTRDSEGQSTAGKVLLAFSVYTNGKKILNPSHTPGSITCIHGIRFISMTWVILGHTFVFGLTAAENYPTYLTETMGLWSFQAVIGAPVSVDTFFSISGLLVTYLILKEMEKRNGKVQWFLFYFHRFWRLTPPYAFVMMMLIALFRYFGDGPNWLQEGTEINSCRDTWWTNLLYINNFVRVREMCINWSWYLANDMQFYIVSPLLFVPLYFWRRLGVVLAYLWLLATMVTAGVLSRVNNYPPSISVSRGTSLAESANYFEDFYIKPYCRFGPYVIGMLTGYALFITKSRVKMNLAISLSGWAMATAAGLAVVYGLYGPANGHDLTADVSALYNSASHTVWGACVCWVIFACATGHGGPVNALLSWTAFIPLSRLTYMAYLVHPIIMNLYHLGAPSAFYMSTFHIAILFLGFTVAAFGTAFVLSLAFEAPMMALEKVLFRNPRKH